MTLGVFVEGPSDRQIIPILIRRLGYRAAIHTRVVRQGDMLNSSRMSQHVEGLLRMRGQLHEILVFMDSEGVDPEETLHRTKPVSVELNRVAGRIPVRFIIVDHSLEDGSHVILKLSGLLLVGTPMFTSEATWKTTPDRLIWLTGYSELMVRILLRPPITQRLLSM